MPTYEYKCDKCGHAMEAFHPMKDKPLRKCPKCGKNGLRRLMGAGAALIFKGSGFYSTDYRKGGARPADSPSKPETSEAPAGQSDSAGNSKDSGGTSKTSDSAKKKD